MISGHEGTLTPTRSPIRSKDIAEIVIGSFMLAAPISVTEEVWNR